MNVLSERNSEDTQQAAFPGYLPWIVWGLGAAFFFVEYFARTAPSVMVPELMRDFHVTAAALGGISTSFYIAYVAMQIPVGMLVDRLGPHRLLTFMCLLCAVASLMFATAQGVAMGSLSRFFLGFGSAFAFVGSLKLAAVWFPARRFGLLSGLTQALGMLGVALGNPTVAESVSSVGWRETMHIIAGLFVVLAIAIWLIVRDHPHAQHNLSGQNREDINVFRGLWQVLKNPQSWLNGVFVGFLYASTAVIGEMWGVSYFVTAYGFTKQFASLVISTVFIGWAIGGPICGYLSDYIGRRKPLLIGSALAGLVILSIVIFIPQLPTPLLFLLLFLYGMTNTGVAISYAVASEINPKAISGTSMAFANMASVLVGALLLPVVGWVLDKNWDGLMQEGIRIYTASAYRAAFVAVPVLFLISILFALLMKETHCKNIDSET